ncbi:MucBP domain-containing protein, partial [Enterococcus florum]|uniref:MucBP domain-containing protein n=1 Tax=Enterococcus florum TaxID=2480627 RepID=UPI0011BA906B
GYTIQTVPANKAGKYKEGIITVTYIYKKNKEDVGKTQGSVVTKYVDGSDNEIAGRNAASGEIGTAYTTIEKKIPGYTIIETPKNAKGSYQEGLVTVTYRYKKIDEQRPVIQGTVAVKYVDETNKEIAKQTIYTGNIGESYATQEKNISGYALKNASKNAKGTYQEGEITVVYTYKKDTVETPIIEGIVEVRYVDQNEVDIAGRNTQSGVVDEMYETQPKIIPGFSLETIPDNAKGNYLEGKITVTYVYKKISEPEPILEGTLLVKYVDIAGKELAKRQKYTGIVGSDYQTEAKNIPGYELKTSPKEANGKYIEGIIEISYVYSSVELSQPVVEGTVIVKYLDVSGKEIASSQTLTGEIETEYAAKEKNILGYELVTTPENATGKYQEGTIEIAYVYKKIETPTPIEEGTVLVRYVDEKDKELVLSQTITGEIGTNYVTEAKMISGYIIKITPENAKGSYQKEPIEVTYVYKKDNKPVEKGKVIVKYQDETGERLTDSEIMTGDIGSSYETKQKAIDGYTLKISPKNARGKYAEEAITVCYVYQKSEHEKNQTDDKDRSTTVKDAQSNQGTNLIKKETQETTKGTLPKTGEQISQWWKMAGILIVGLVSLLVGKKIWEKRKKSIRKTF